MVTYIQRNEGRHPTMAMNNVRYPTQLAHGLKHPSAEEQGTLVIVGTEGPVRFVGVRLTLEVLFVVDELDLHARAWYTGHLDQQRMVRVVDYQVHPA